ncbi:hypothetical protein LZ31DRAFT_561091 [Colletotrichum somersetense]|nr:hypothetical protein LZ31DRAFT_561091 [Colletotrichum somersetense]
MEWSRGFVPGRTGRMHETMPARIPPPTSLIRTMNGFTPLSSSPTIRRAKTTTIRATPANGDVGGIAFTAPTVGVSRIKDPSLCKFAVVSRFRVSRPWSISVNMNYPHALKLRSSSSVTLRSGLFLKNRPIVPTHRIRCMAAMLNVVGSRAATGSKWNFQNLRDNSTMSSTVKPLLKQSILACS